jgi:hypothetical protein
MKETRIGRNTDEDENGGVIFIPSGKHPLMGNSYENMRLRTNIDKKLPMFLKNGRLWQSYRHA